MGGLLITLVVAFIAILISYPKLSQAILYPRPFVVLVGDSISMGAGSFGSLPWGINPGGTPADFLRQRLNQEPAGNYWQTSSVASLGLPGLQAINWANYDRSTCTTWLSASSTEKSTASTFPLLGYPVMEYSCNNLISMD